MSGYGNTCIDLNNKVQGKQTLQQTSLMLAVNALGSDTLFESKGTELVPGLINNNYIGYSTAQHTCNFASLDIKEFLNEVNLSTKDNVKVSEILMTVIRYYPEQSKIDVQQIVQFSDDTQTEPVTTTI